MIKILKRHTVVGILIILCFFSAFMALCNGLLSVIQTSNLIQKETEYAYNNEVLVTIFLPEEVTLSSLLQLTDSVHSCNIYLENMEIYFDEINSVYRPDILIRQNEILSLPTSKDVTELPENTIIAASSNVIGLKEVNIHDKTFTIYDTMNSKEFPFITGLFVLSIGDYHEAFPDAFSDMNEVILRISSNEDDVYAAYSQIKNNLEMNFPKSNITNSDISIANSLFNNLLTQENIISIGLFLFALINTIIISYYWVTVRRREIAIRKAYGAKNFTIIVMMTNELLKLIGFSAMLALIIQVGIWSIQGNGFSMQNSITIIGLILLSITTAVIIAMVVPVRYILQIQPSEGVKL